MDDLFNENQEFLLANLFREVGGIGSRGQKMPTYQQAAELMEQLDRDLIPGDKSFILGRAKKSETAQKYEQEADAMSVGASVQVSAVSLIEKRLDTLKELTKKAKVGEDDLLRKERSALEKAKREFQAITENQAIFSDAYQVSRKPLIEFDQSFSMKDYKVENDRYLRVRVIHPDKPEHTLGADLIYETHDTKQKKIRIVVVQYKMWDKGVLYSTASGNLMDQLAKMQKAICQGDFCKTQPKDQKYRLPPCAAFLRPTDKIQSKDTTLRSRSLHLPICAVNDLWHETNAEGLGKKLDSRYIRNQSVSQKIFEELFNVGMIGSGWLAPKVLKKLYEEHRILQDRDSVLIHAQEF